MKERIRWSPRFQHWYHIGSVLMSERDRRALAFVLELNKLNNRRN